jgi:peptidase E
VTKGDDPDYAALQIKNATVIYLGGGDTSELIDFFYEFSLFRLLKEAHYNGACLVGMSAGALALSKWYVHERGGEGEGESFELRDGWGLVNICTYVHAHPEGIVESKRLMDENNLDPNLFVGIEEGTALYIKQGKKLHIGTGKVYT